MIELHRSLYMAAALLLTVCSCEVIETTRWNLLPSNNLEMTLIPDATSLTSCGLSCSQRDGCGRFCFKANFRVCYVTGGVPSSTCIPSDTSYTCYKTGNCPVDEGYLLTDAHCIKLYQTPLDYTSARDVCTSDGGHLYHFKSVALDLPPLVALMDHNALTSPSDTIYFYTGLWMGGDDLTTEGTYIWSDGTLVPTTTGLFSPGEPNNFFGVEDCIELYGPTSRLNDNHCLAQKMYICQIDM
ncbi:hypothetical protein BaRGS_00016518 [Batillaria attramentaria]|uniref:C-type lectin domain-containing protein n=1 Tax=Batillaria attramentaria TaxID=370345 RepID=A0ABD0KYC3_9CAEN